MCEGCFWNWPVIRAGNETWHRVCGSDTLVRCGPGSEDQPRAQILSPYPREPMLRRDNGYYAWGDFVNWPPHVGPRPSAAKALLRTSDRAVIFGRRPKVRQRRIIGLEELIERVSHDWISPKAADRAIRSLRRRSSVRPARDKLGLALAGLPGYATGGGDEWQRGKYIMLLGLNEARSQTEAAYSSGFSRQR